MRKTLSILLGTTTLLFGAPTVTKTTFIEYSPGITEKFMKIDKHGNSIYESKVQIETKNFEVKNFWKKFSLDGEGQDSMKFDSISKTGTIQITAEATSICSKYEGLNEEGCSGQKPFLINQEALSNINSDGTISLLFQKDYNGTDILYDSDEDSVFYPLDIGRKGKYYKDPENGETSSHKCKSFFCAMTNMFNGFFGSTSDRGGFFSNFFNHNVAPSISNPTVEENKIVIDVRKRYIANITAGIDQIHLLAEEDKVKLELNNAASLIDYVEDTTVTGTNGNCKLFFIKFSEDSKFCSFMSGMPFIRHFASSTTTIPNKSVSVDTIQADTENALIAFAGNYSGINRTDYKNGAKVYNEEPIATRPTGFLSRLKCFFFRCPATATVKPIEVPKDTYYTFDDNKSIYMTMAVSNSISGTNINIDNFQTFKLKSIHSLTGSEKMCKVTSSYAESEYEKSSDYWVTKEFRESDIGTTVYLPKKTVVQKYKCVTFFDSYPLTSSSCKFGYIKKKDGTNTTYTKTDWTSYQWLEWCDTQIENPSYAIKEVCTGHLFWKKCHTETIDTIVQDGYTINSYISSSKRGLMIDLLPIEKLEITDKAVRLRYKLMSTN